MLVINNVTKMYNETAGVRNISLHIPKGCIYGLIGLNGAGKTTIIKMVTGLLQPDSIGTNITAPNGQVMLVPRQG